MTCAASIAAFLFSSKTPEKASDLTLENIEVVGLAAGEWMCDGMTMADCEIQANGVVGKGTGRLVLLQIK